MDLALNNLQRLICHKTQPTKPKLIDSYNTIMCKLFLIKTSYLKL